MAGKCDSPCLADFIILNQTFPLINFLLNFQTASGTFFNSTACHSRCGSRKFFSRLYMIFQTEFYRIKIQLPGYTAHHQLSSKSELGVAVTPEGTGYRIVGSYRIAVEEIIRNTVLKFTAGSSHDRWCMGGIWTAIQIVIRLKCC